ncbi:MAG TPA: hypothetical protein VHP33_03270 [Polyangiaceae bacterium]|nr:hypothetical protein [Polyangiaceae bacterium]
MGYCTTNNCSQSAAIRTALAKLAKASDDPAQQYTALLDVLGLGEADPTTITTDQIESALRDLLAAYPPEGNQPVPDPMAAPADAPPPPALAASKPAPAAVHLTPAQIEARKAAAKPAVASKLSDAQRAALTRKGLPHTEHAWASLCKSAARAAGKTAAPARAAAPTTPRGDVSKLSKASLEAARKAGISPQEMADRMARAARAAR